MAVKSEITMFVDELTTWRRDLHAHPETAFEEFRTADVVAEKLEQFGIEVHRGLATTGVVGTLSVGNSNRAIGLRADMDALDIAEENRFDYASTVTGKMNILPESVYIAGTCRSHEPAVQEQIEQRLRQVVDGVCAAHGVAYELDYQRRYPATINTPQEAENALRAATEVAGTDNVIRDLPPSMGSEDFSWMLQDNPGCYIRVGNGDGGKGSCVVHNPNYDFNDDALIFGASYWATLVEQQLAMGDG